MPSLVDNMIAHLTQGAALKAAAHDAGLKQRLQELQQWQCQRLLITHKDLWQHKRFNPAMTFFIDELYGPKDFSQRDQDIARVVPKMAKLLPEKAMESLEAALHLNTLSLQLDLAMVTQLKDASIDRLSYAEAYRQCDNLALRQQQIDYIEELGRDLADVVKIKGIATLLMLSRKPAKLAGVLALHEFIEEGFKAFKQLGDVNDFIEPVVNRERVIMMALYADPQDNVLPEGQNL